VTLWQHFLRGAAFGGTLMLIVIVLMSL